ncbi:MAG: hypothetical protein WCT49_00320 [Candidatus Paceibacterota bacterium]|jgi:hypothetical protein|nr:hypothetical protein [Candidatus Paceibacterota bacterium]
MDTDLPKNNTGDILTADTKDPTVLSVPQKDKTEDEKAALFGLKNLPLSVVSQNEPTSDAKTLPDIPPNTPINIAETLPPKKEFRVPKKPDIESKLMDKATGGEDLSLKSAPILPKKDLGWKTLTPTVNVDAEDLSPKRQNVIPPTINRPAITRPSNTTKTPKEKVPESKAEDISALPTLRTYKKDVAGTIKDQKTSLVRMVLEEEKARAKRELNESPQSGKNLPLILFSVVFLLLSIGVVYYAFFRPVDKNNVFTELNVVPLLGTEHNKEIVVTGKSAKDLSSEISRNINGDIKLDTIEFVYFVNKDTVTTEDGVTETKTILRIDDLFNILHIPIPQNLLRSLKTDYMFGFHNFNGNQPFLVLKTDYYDSAFAEMLSWEPTMLDDIYPLFRLLTADDLRGRAWVDVVAKNKDTRQLKDFSDETVLVYIFKDQNTIILSTSENTLFEVARRLDLTLEKK